MQCQNASHRLTALPCKMSMPDCHDNIVSKVLTKIIMLSVWQRGMNLKGHTSTNSTNYISARLKI